MKLSLSKTLVGSALTGIALLACAASEVDLGNVVTPASFFTEADASEGVEAGGDARLLCIGTTCPAGLLTCPTAEGMSFPCGVDVTKDNANCGACGIVCPSFPELNALSRCVAGRCELQCRDGRGQLDSDFRNCNDLVDDGCETNVVSDTKHCGVCGNACPAGQPCFKGTCGCPAGKSPCGGTCVDLQNSDENCGACGVKCQAPQVGCEREPPLNTYFGCRAGVCERLKCTYGSADCNADVPTKGCLSDGCEVAPAYDEKNCGGCGNVCKAGESCFDGDKGPTCTSCPGETKCEGYCADLTNWRSDCGSCGNSCPPAGPNAERVCLNGVCAPSCRRGFFDCNGVAADGCEVDMRTDPTNCGACGKQCDLAAGQPCLNGKCLETACAPGQTR